MSTLKVLLIGLIALALGLTGSGYLYLRQSLPQREGQLVLPGLVDEVEVLWDRWGVPHVYAQSADDLFFAQGYVTAQDRLWQMDFNRRVATGRLAEVLGPRALPSDTFVRTVGLNRAAQAAARDLDPESTSILEAYARGVNAYIENRVATARLPWEFAALGYRPEPWRPVDAVAISKLFAWQLAQNMYDELWRAQVLARFGEAKLRELEPQYPLEGTYFVPANRVGANRCVRPRADASVCPYVQPTIEPALLPALQALTDQYDQLSFWLSKVSGIGSNNWVIAGSKSATGKPLLANDPHLMVGIPPIWYEIHLEAPGWRAAGASAPGAPSVVLGHNERIAWGVTNVEADVQDLFVEKFNSENPQQYEYRGQWEETQIVREEIRVRGQDKPVIKEVLLTRHGPLVTDVVSGTQDRVALSWTALNDPNWSTRGSLRIAQAQNWEEFRAIVAEWPFAFNFVYADVDGNIGYQMSGHLPLRPIGDGRFPVPGWSGEYDWVGFIPFAQLPSVLNPEGGIIITANNRIIARDFVPDIPAEWEAGPPQRARRIYQLLHDKEVLSLEDSRAVQADAFSETGYTLARLLVQQAQAQDPLQRRALELLARWDGQLSEESVAATIVTSLKDRLVTSVFRSKLGGLGYSSERGTALYLDLAKQSEPSPWLDDPETPQRESASDVLQTSFAQTLNSLRQRFGPDMNRWTWGRAHIQTFAHPLGQIPLVGRWLNRSIPVRGGSGTVFAASRGVSSLRLLLDTDDWNRSRSGLTTGQSGHPLGRHYDDQLQSWRTAQPHPLLWDRARVASERSSMLRLVPQSK